MNQRGRRQLASLVALLAIWATPAGAARFDFDVLPDSAGCSRPVPSPASGAGFDVARAFCDAAWVDELELGLLTRHEQTLRGITLSLSAQGEPLNWDGVATSASDGLPFPEAGGTISCGNTFDCGGYLADFSKELVSAEVELLGALDRSGGGEVEPATYYLEAWSEAGGTGELIARVEADAADGPATLSLTGGGKSIRSLLFGATAAGGDCDPFCRNLGVADNLVVDAIPEPGAALLFGAGALVVARHLRRRPR